MVEPPIKKSDRQAKPQTEDNAEVKAEVKSEQKSVAPPVKLNRKDRDGDRDNRQDRGNRQDRDKGKGKGRKSSGRDEIKAPLNPALARPPKPSKPPVKVEAPPEEVSEIVAEESQDSNQATAEAVAEESQDSNQEQNNS